MSGGSRKRARGGGGGAGKRPIRSNFQPMSIRRSSGPPGGHLPLGSGAAGPRIRSTAVGAAPPAPSNAPEETFSLVNGNHLHFAVIIRLAPDLMEEIKRAEAHGSTPRIKFGSNANSSAENVINVGSKDFSFTWSRDRGDLCDIYEECQGDEDGNRLLVESGSAWRKVNVQRVLDESTKNHVKMLSEEAERKSKSRKTIVLESGNPSTKSQVKARAAVEGNPCKTTFKRPPQKKRKVEPPSARSPPKASQKSSLPTTTHSKGPSTKPAHKKSTSSSLSDLQCMLINVLKDNQSNGMTLKALEKAVGEAFPNSARQIETMVKKVAIFRAPGRYFLKPGVEIESLKKSTIESGSSPLEKSHTSPTHTKHEVPVPKSSLLIRTDPKAFKGQLQLNSKLEEASTSLEKVDIVQLSPDYVGEQKAPDHSEGPADIFSDSDSESNHNDSGCKSRSKSPVQNGSGSGGTSDSESDISSNSEDSLNDSVDIMESDDDRGAKYKQKVSENGLSEFPIPLTSQDSEPSQFRIGEKDYTRVADILEIEKVLPDEEMTNLNESGLIDQNRLQTRKLDSGTVKLTDNQSNGFERAPTSKCERVPDGKQVGKPVVTNRQETGSMHEHNISVGTNRLFAKDAVQDKHQTYVDSHDKRHVSSQNRALQPLSQKHYSTVDQSVAEYLNDKSVEMNSKNRHNITGGSLEFYGDDHGKVATVSAQHDKSNDAFQERRESSPDETNSSYSKYERKEPELRVPIKGFTQYKEYVEEYHEKYEKYCSLMKNLESYRFKFCELGKDLHVYKRTDMERYYEILARLKDSYCRYGPRHKRLKKIFVVLHEELKHLKQMISDFAASHCTDHQ